MKKILFMLGIIGLTAVSGSAQEKKCVCVKKTVHHAAHKTTSAKTATAYTKTRHTRYYSYKAHPVALNGTRSGCSIDSNGEIEYNTSGIYAGFYPNDVECDGNELLIPRFKNLVVASSAFKNNGVLPAKYTCQGQQVSPPLNVTNIPNGTRSLAIIMFDPHATTKKSTTYWLMWDLDTTGNIPENFTNDHESTNPVNMQYGYQAVCPLAGTHYYHFRVYALDTKLMLDRHATKATLENTMRGHVLAKGEIVGEYNKHLD